MQTQNKKQQSKTSSFKATIQNLKEKAKQKQQANLETSKLLKDVNASYVSIYGLKYEENPQYKRREWKISRLELRAAYNGYKAYLISKAL